MTIMKMKTDYRYLVDEQDLECFAVEVTQSAAAVVVVDAEAPVDLGQEEASGA